MAGVLRLDTSLTEAPSPRSSACSVLWEQQQLPSPTTTPHQKLVVFGGIGIRAFFNDVHVLDLQTRRWERWDGIATPNSFGPQPRGSAASCLCNHRFLTVFGGRTEFGLLGDLFLLDLVQRTWLQVQCAGANAPPPREDACCVCASAGENEIVVFGGTDASGQVLSDMWVCNVHRPVWHPVVQVGEAPPDGLSAASCCSLGPHTALVFGGYDGRSFKNCTYVLDLCQFVWRRVEMTGAAADFVPRPRTHASFGVVWRSSPSASSSTYSSASLVVQESDTFTCALFAGYAGSVALGDVWLLDCVISSGGSSGGGCHAGSAKWITVRGSWRCADEYSLISSATTTSPSSPTMMNGASSRGLYARGAVSTTLLSVPPPLRPSPSTTPSSDEIFALVAFGGCNGVEFLDDVLLVAPQTALPALCDKYAKGDEGHQQQQQKEDAQLSSRSGSTAGATRRSVTFSAPPTPALTSSAQTKQVVTAEAFPATVTNGFIEQQRDVADTTTNGQSTSHPPVPPNVGDLGQLEDAVSKLRREVMATIDSKHMEAESNLLQDAASFKVRKNCAAHCCVATSSSSSAAAVSSSSASPLSLASPLRYKKEEEERQKKQKTTSLSSSSSPRLSSPHQARVNQTASPMQRKEFAHLKEENAHLKEQVTQLTQRVKQLEEHLSSIVLPLAAPSASSLQQAK